MQRLKVGRESDFFAHPLVTGIELTDNLKIGDRIRISGHAAGLERVVESMQVDNTCASEASAGPARQQGFKVTDQETGL